MKIKLTYVAPLTRTLEVHMDTSVVTSSADVYSIDQEIQTICPETRCPFNGNWCRDKQRVLDEWESAIRYYAQKGVSNLIHTRADMFDGCPHNFMTLCSLHEQRQH